MRKPPSMPPPESGPAVLIGVSGKSKGSKPDGADHQEPDADDEKCSPERAISVKADEHCKDCQNYHPDTGECDEVQGTWEPEDACFAHFEPLGQGEPDADDMGGPDATADQPEPDPTQ